MKKMPEPPNQWIATGLAGMHLSCMLQRGYFLCSSCSSHSLSHASKTPSASIGPLLVLQLTMVYIRVMLANFCWSTPSPSQKVRFFKDHRWAHWNIHATGGKDPYVESLMHSLTKTFLMGVGFKLQRPGRILVRSEEKMRFKSSERGRGNASETGTSKPHQEWRAVMWWWRVQK